MKKLLVCQFYTSNLKYAIQSEEINKKYCQKFNIDYISQTNDDIIKQDKDGRAFCWYKIIFLLQLLKQKQYEYIMFIDADAVFVRDDYNILNIIEENQNFDFICSNDFGPDIINSGVLIFKNTDWSIDFLERVWDSANYVSRGKYKLEIWHEQTIISAFMLINPDDRAKTKILSHYDNNAINDHILRPGKTLIYHDLSKIRIAEIYKMIFGNFDLMTELNLTCNSDRHVAHGYGSFYKQHIDTLCQNNRPIKILDIGGDNGVLFNIFTKYYPNIQYTNITTHNYDNNNNNNMMVLYAPHIDETYLRDFLSTNNEEYDIIIADYKHSCEMRDLLFSLFFDRIVSGGLFVVEDLQTDAEISIPEKNAQYGWGDPNKKSMTQLINQFNIDQTFNSDYVDFKDLGQKIKSASIYKSVPHSSLLGLIYKK